MIVLGSCDCVEMYRRCRRQRSEASVQSRESICAPVFAADAMVEEEEPIGIVFSLDREKPGVVFAPESLLPMRLEVICFPHIRANAGQELADLVHRRSHCLRVASR